MLLCAVAAANVRVVDFGAEGVGGYPVLIARHVKGPARIRLSYATHPNGLGPKGDFWHETRATYLGEGVDLPIRPASTDRFDIFDVPTNGTYRAPLQQGLVRYVRIAVEDGSADVDVEFDNRGTHSTEPVVGSFECSDPELTKIWRASVRTCQLAAIPGRGTETLPYLSDGAKRDRLVWSGDLWWAQRNMYVAFGPSSPYLPGSLDMLAENQTPSGYVNACPYPESRGPITTESYGPFGSDEFAAWFVPVLADHYLYTGDRALLERRYPNAVKVLDYLSSHQDADGLFQQRAATAKHSEGLAVGGTSLHHRTYMHLLLWRANADAARLATWLGRTADAQRFSVAADRLAELLRKRFFRPALGRFGLSLEQPDAPAFTANAAALAFGFLSGDEAKGVLAQLSRHEHGKFQMMAMRGAFELRDGTKALELLNAHNWRAVVSDGWQGTHLTSECMNLPCGGWGDEAHPDTALAGVFTDYILGVRPTAPGYETYVVDPIPVPGITWAKGCVPTPKGSIKVEWHLVDGRPDVKVSAPSRLKRMVVSSAVAKREGFVRVEERDGRWTAVRSDGEPFTVLGVDHCQHWGMNCEDLGFSPYGKYVKEHYPSAEAWADETLGRLKSWGFTALGWGCDIRNLGHRGLVHTEYLNMGESVCTGSDPSRWRSEYKWAPGTAFPNVDHPDFPSACDAVAAKKCAASREDSDLLGYFIDNELNWWAACAHPHGRPDLEELARVADRYFAVTTAAIRRHDPNHLILGCRFAGFEGADEVVWKAAAKYCDVVTFNCYPWADLDRNVVLDRKGGVPIKERFDAFHKLVGRPLLVTEWSFPALDSGCPCLHGAGQRFRTQAQRTRASLLFARTLLSLPYVIGYNYFMWVDQPKSGLNHFFPEDSNYGLVSEENVPYQELTSMFARLQGEASRWRQAKIPAERTVKMLPKRTERERYIDAAKGSGEAVAFRREGADWTLSNDAGLVLRGTVGAGRDMVHAVILDGKSIGTLGGLVEMADNGERVWIDARDVKVVKCVQEGAATSVSVTAEGEGWNRRFALTLRYTLAPGRRDFVADIESLRNESDLPMPVAHLFLRPYASEQPAGVVPQVPNLWKEPSRSVWRLSNGITYGAESDDADIAFFNLHLESDGAMRPDVAFTPPNGLVLQPGAVYRPPRPMSARMIIGKEK